MSSTTSYKYEIWDVSQGFYKDRLKAMLENKIIDKETYEKLYPLIWSSDVEILAMGKILVDNALNEYLKDDTIKRIMGSD